MATVKNIGVNNYCDKLNTGSSDMKAMINTLRNEAKRAYGVDNPLYAKNEQHLTELADMIDWKLQLLLKTCPFDWKGADKDVETTVSVGPEGKRDFSGGYIGG